MEWKKELRAKFERDELRRLISNVNWIIFKPKIKKAIRNTINPIIRRACKI